MTRSRLLILLFLLPSMAGAAQNTTRPAPKPTGFKAEFLAQLDDIEDKTISLAETMPASTYSWRPVKGVRSVSEVYMHISGSNYFLPSFLGADAPKTKGDPEKTVTRKSEVLAELRRSFDHLRAVANNAGDLDAPVKMFGNQTSRRGVLLTIMNHLHEHLGQSIAYARMNGVVPPWSH
jgi:uncharacterized damage-inducible protein DinB